MPDQIQVDDPGMRLGAIADQIARSRLQIDGKPQSLADHGLAIHQRSFGMQSGQITVRHNGLTLTESNLVQPHPWAHQHREGAGADLGIERA